MTVFPKNSQKAAHMTNKIVAWFEEIDKSDVAVVGGKGANLGEMTSFGMPVPPGFVVTAAAYRAFIDENKLKPKIHEVLDRLNVNDPVQLQKASTEIKKLIIHSPIPDDISKEVMSSYAKLGKKLHRSTNRMTKLLSSVRHTDVSVAVRSSATSEDSKDASFAGQNETFLNIKGDANVADAVRRCWASLFEARSIFYRKERHFDHFQSYIAVVVQAMVQSDVSGIMFSIDPVTNNKSRIVIETVWGLGEYIVQGKVTPDHYEVNKSDLMITDRKFVSQKIMLARDKNGVTKELPVPKSKVDQRKITDKEIIELARLSRELEKHYYFPQDSEFAVSEDGIYLVQTRPITTTVTTDPHKTPEFVAEAQKSESSMELLVVGAPASPGVQSGPVKILKSASEIDRIKPGDVLVAEQTNPDYVPAMKKASAIVTDKGGRTSHAAIVSRELGIPCVVGTDNATHKLKDGQVITVDGSQGKVFLGAPKIDKKFEVQLEKILEKRKDDPTEPTKTATKVYVNLAEPEKAAQIAALNCDGIGLLRAEFMLAGIGIHPKKIIEERKQRVYIDTLAEQIETFAKAFYPRPVVYRATDFKTNEYRSLKGGDKYELHEENPMIGFRGAFRYVMEPEVFAMEVEALKRVREESGFNNLWLMIPFCRTVSELEKVKALLSKFGLRRSESFKLWMMCEIPSNVILLDKFLEAGIDGISVGSNDLTMLTLGVDRDNETVASEYDERNEAVMWSFERIIKTCRKYDVTCSMCGQAPSQFPDLTEKLVEMGITSVSVSPDVITKTREIVYEAEKKLARK